MTKKLNNLKDYDNILQFITDNWENYTNQAELLHEVAVNFQLDYYIESLENAGTEWSYSYPYATYYSKNLNSIILFSEFREQSTPKDLTSYAYALQSACEGKMQKTGDFIN